MTKVAIIGAGLSGLALARQLRIVADVTVFEKSRGAGGRIATRYADAFEFDHGAQFFTARSPAFRAFLEPLLADGVIANWPARFAELDRDRIRDARSWSEDYPHFVGTPRMNSIGKALSSDLDVVLETTITEFERNSDGWIVFNDKGENLGQFDWVVLTAPAAQSQDLASGVPELISLCRARSMRGCFALMLGFEQPLQLPWDAALVRNADISWISVNSSKPGRGEAFTLLVHSTNAWADAHIEDDLEDVTAHMLGEASAVSGNDLTRAAHCRVHRWRYANIDKQVGPTFFVDDSKQLAACGDWFVRGRIEAAFTSAHDLGQVLRELL
jgi:predicted NAD/FAD-dependent oxidoreductase